MGGWIVCIFLLIPLVFLYCKYREKQQLDYEERNKLNTEVELLKAERKNLNSDIEELYKKSEVAIERYNNSLRDKSEELELYFAAQKKRRQQILDEDLEQRKLDGETRLDLHIQQLTQQAQDKVNKAEEEARKKIENWEETQANVLEETNKCLARFEGVVNTLALYEKERQAQLFYTIQLQEEFRDDIEYLLTAVAAKVQHPDIISKLVWAEYVKPNLDATFKRLEIKPESGIYKLTSLETGKSYIGKSTDVKKRIADHFKSAVGIKSIADQAVHHAILKEGFWNWSIEVIIYCDKDKLNELEKYYIDFFKTQEFGYNKNSGGGG